MERRGWTRHDLTLALSLSLLTLLSHRLRCL